MVKKTLKEIRELIIELECKECKSHLFDYCNQGCVYGEMINKLKKAEKILT